MPGGPVMKAALEIYAELTETGYDVILDDRELRPGFKFKDSELVGFPVRLGIGTKSLEKGNVELTLRSSNQRESVPLDQAVAKVKSVFADV